MCVIAIGLVVGVILRGGDEISASFVDKVLVVVSVVSVVSVVVDKKLIFNVIILLYYYINVFLYYF
uniref:Uncharacterized protein n=1 Tax=viral metagenome TaxID=1070528 RepID=A0A6C0EYH1_9ZZZZ